MSLSRESCAEGIDPLWPASHLPHKGESRRGMPFAFQSRLILLRRLERSERPTAPFSPLVGEMAGRPE
ncbi:hypothetical protein CN217_31710, partial [Sinorhizobium meliloti]